jgi:predicted negative regulator of RcsB-dependent stress response
MAIVRGGAVLVVSVGLVWAVAGWQSRPPPSSVDACRDARYDEPALDVARLCERAWQETGSDEAAALTALTLLRADRAAEVPAWLPRVGEGTARARVLHYTGDAYQALGRTGDAILAYEGAVTVGRAYAPNIAVNAALNLKAIAQDQGRYGDAVRLALVAWRESRAMDANAQRAALLGVVDLLAYLGDLRTAEAALLEAERITSPGDPLAVRVAIAGAELHASRGRPVLARQAFSAIAARDDFDQLTERAYVETALADLALATGDGAAADRYLASARQPVAARATDPVPPSGDLRLVLEAQRALQRGHATAALAVAGAAAAIATSPSLHARIDVLRGDALAALGQRGDAETAYRSAVATVEDMRAQVGILELRQDLIDRYRAPFEALFDALARRGAWDDALAVVEAMHARGHRDAILAAAVTAPAVAGDSLDGHADGAVRRADALTRILSSLTTAPVPAPPRSGDLARRVGERDVVAFVSARGRLWRLRITGGAVAGKDLGALTALTPAIDAMVGSPDDHAAADALGAALVGDVLPPAERVLFVVPDPALARVPVAALRVGGVHVVERVAVALAPTVASLGTTEPAATWTDSIVLGDPTGDLAAARREAEDVAARLGTSPLVGKAASRGALARARRARVLHVASHLLVDPTGPLLRLADGDVGTADLLALGLRPRLAFLASCASAVGDHGDPWRSTASALLAGGARGVVATTRSVADDAARTVVDDFYGAGGASRPAHALAAAQRRAIARGVPASTWAAFVFLGSAP